AAGYWQATTGMRFRLAVPATPFVPARLAGAPTISGLVEDVMPRLAGSALGAARLRAFLIADRVAAVVVMPSGGSRWRRIVARATVVRPVRLGRAQVYRVTPKLHPLRALGDLAVAHQPHPEPTLASDRDTNAVVSAWLTFDGRRARVRALLRTSHRRSRRAVVLSAPNGDSDATAAAVDDHGRVAVVFTEWRDYKQMLRIATHGDGRWRVDTLDHIAVAGPDGTLVRWLERDPRGGHLVRFEARLGQAGWIVARAATPGYGRAVHLRARHA